MFQIISVLVLYVFGFVLLYGVVRLAVRHAIEDATNERQRRAMPEEALFP
jgi:F0F1-type ATP synthase membrane subunit b/b'